jgi:hypothetical protein
LSVAVHTKLKLEANKMTRTQTLKQQQNAGGKQTSWFLKSIKQPEKKESALPLGVGFKLENGKLVFSKETSAIISAHDFIQRSLANRRGNTPKKTVVSTARTLV